jgi:hypothetical protein
MKSNWILLLRKHIWREIDKKNIYLFQGWEATLWSPCNGYDLLHHVFSFPRLMTIPFWYQCSSPPIFLYKTRKCFFCLLSSRKCASRWHLLFLLLIKCLMSSIFTHMVPILDKGQKWSQSWIKDSCS